MLLMILLDSIKNNLTFSIGVVLFSYLIILNNRVTFAQDQKNIIVSPKDYSYSTINSNKSRVRDLINFFDNLKDSTSYDPEIREKQNVIISLAEAASKLHFLLDEFPIDIKCNKYVNLINKPNVRTYSMINELANEDKLFHEITQQDSNVFSKIEDARRFDALTKLQTIIQTLESERDSGKIRKSLFEPTIQQELLDCITYFIYKHQRATTGLIDYVRNYELKNNLNSINHNSVGSELNVKKFNKISNEIKQLERDIDNDDNSNKNSTIINWLNSFFKLQQLSIENNYQLPKIIVDFITDPKRLDKLKTLNDMFEKVELLKSNIQQLETNLSGSNLRNDNGYKNSLLELAHLVNSYKELLSNETFLFIHKPTRWLLIERLLKNNSEISEEDKVLTGEEVTTTVEVDEKEDKDQKSQQEQNTSQLTEQLLDYSDPIPPSIKLPIDNITSVEQQQQTCPNFSTQLSNDLRSFNHNIYIHDSNYVDDNFDYVRNQINRLYSYISQCNSEDNNHYFMKQSNWPLLSLMKKVTSWIESSIQKYKQLSSEIIEILDLIKKSKPANNNVLLTGRM